MSGSQMSCRYIALGSLNFLLLRLLGGSGLSPLIAPALLLPVLAACGYLGLRALVFRGPDPQAAPWGSDEPAAGH
jgi:hypothetical protein